MKKLLPILILFSIVIGGCKKSKTPEAPEGANKPIISSITPNVVTTGSLVSITGNNFGTSGNGLSLLFNGKMATIQSVTPTELKVVVPETTSGNISLLAGGESINGPSFVFIDQGKIASITPSSGSPGTLVRIAGNSFGAFGPVKVTFNGKVADVKSTTATEIFAVVPDTTSGNVVVASGNFAVQGAFFTINGPAKITSVSPDNGTSGVVATLTGSNFGSSVSGVSVSISNKSATVLSVAPTEIKVLIPVTTTGKVILSINGQVTEGPVFTYTSPLSTPYTGGNVSLSSQAEVDAFAAQNKGKSLQITGSLTISGNDITSLAGLSNITSVSGSVSVSGSQISNLAFLNSITSVGGLTLQNLPASTITMDNLTTATGLVRIASCTNLRTLSFKSLSTITGNLYLGSLTISACPQLSDINAKNLTSATYNVTISGTALTDLSAFSALKNAGALTISGNLNLSSLQGLENLNQLTLPALRQGIMGGLSSVNGIVITGNPKLSSLNGIQNLATVPIAGITQNTSLTDLCPAKGWLNNLANLPNYNYRRQDGLGRYITVNLSALNLTANGSYSTRADALAALALCK